MLRNRARTVFICLAAIGTLVSSRDAGAATSVVISQMGANPPSFELLIEQTQASQQYDVERTSDITGGSWNVIGTFTGTGNNVIFYDNTIGAATRAFYRAVLSPNPPPVPALIPQTGWTLKYVDSQELSNATQNGCCPPTPATNAFDGDPTTFWHSEWNTAQPGFPHEIQIDLGAVYSVNGFRELPRQDGLINGRIAQYNFYTSTDGTNWLLVATGTFANSPNENQILFPAQTARYVRLVALSTFSGDGFLTSLAELNVLTDQSPDAAIPNPAADVTIVAGQTVSFAGSGTDGNNLIPLSYHWNFGPGSGIPDSGNQNPTVQFNTPGIFTVSLTVTNSMGIADPTPATRVVTVTAPQATFIPQQGWHVSFVDSESIANQGDQPFYAENGHATNAFDGNPNTVWETQYLGTPHPPPPHDLQINLAHQYPVCGFSYLGRQSGTPHGRVGQYEFYVSTDGQTWGSPVAVGMFPNSAAEQRVFFPPKNGQYVRIRELTEVDGQIYAAIAELNVYQAGTSNSQLPTGAIVSPASQDIIVVAGSAVSFVSSASDSNGNLPLTYRWNFQPGSGVEDIPLQNTGLVRFNIPGTYVVTFTVTNSLGAVVQDTRSVTVLGGSVVIPTTNWSVQADSEELLHPATKIFDGQANTFWETDSQSSSPLPHQIQIDLGATYDIGGFRYLPRQDSANGRIGMYRFYVSADGVKWSSAVAAGTFSNSAQEQEVLFASTPGRYVRFQATSEVNGLQYVSTAELTVLRAPMLTPSVKLLQPQSYYQQSSTNLLVQAEASLTSGQGIRLMLDGGTANGGSQVDIYSGPFQTTFPNISFAPHTINTFVIDANQQVVAGLLTHDQATQVGVGDYYVAMGDSITEGISDDISSDDVSQDGRTTGGGFEPVLVNLLASARGHPVIVYNEGIGGDTSLDGTGQTQRLLQKHRSATTFLIMYGTNDVEPTGSGLHPGDPGYAGSYKENLQRIINDVKSAGKTPILAKLPVNLDRDSQMQAYNQVVDELVQENNLVTPPDFHTYFENHLDQLANSLHPNGAGYQGMAQLWFNTLNP